MSVPAVYFREQPSPVGPLVLAVDGEGRVVRITFLDTEGTARQRLEAEWAAKGSDLTPSDALREDTERTADLARQLDEYFAGERETFDLELAPEGTAFQRAVWDRLCAIPPGETRSYGDLARELDKPKAFRAVGQANGRNPIPIVIPCHRVIAADGTLGGYSSGLDRKRRLLALEGLEI